MESLSNLIEIKNYVKFCNLSINPKTKKGGLDTNTFKRGDIVFRYGIEIFTNLKSYTNNGATNKVHTTGSNQSLHADHSQSLSHLLLIKLPPSTL